MNGIHDMGGMHGLGEIEHLVSEPAFNNTWEGRIHAIFISLFATGTINLHEFRHALERMDGGHYLTSSYYEHWLSSVERVLNERGLVTTKDLEEKIAQLQLEEA